MIYLTYKYLFWIAIRIINWIFHEVMQTQDEILE